MRYDSKDEAHPEPACMTAVVKPFTNFSNPFVFNDIIGKLWEVLLNRTSEI
jgi:hypothetical protein